MHMHRVYSVFITILSCNNCRKSIINDFMDCLWKTFHIGLLQIQMASNFLQTPVAMHCTEPGCEAYNKTIQPMKTNAVPAVNILWCKLTDDAKAINHFAPLIHCPESRTSMYFVVSFQECIVWNHTFDQPFYVAEFNTFRLVDKNSPFHCPSCQFLDSIVEEVVQCQYCLVWYHRKCVEFASATSRQQRLFGCGCAANIDRQW